MFPKAQGFRPRDLFSQRRLPRQATLGPIRALPCTAEAAPLPHHYGLYARFLAWALARPGGGYDAFVEGRKQELFQGLAGTLVEIGAGGGRNLRYLPPHLRVVGVEPNPFMHPYFLSEARRWGRAVSLVRGRAEALPFPSDSVDAVLSTLVLCSVAETDRALGEIRRILKPGGRFLFMEHVAAPPATPLRRIQSFVRPLWRRLGDGCEPDRTTGENLARAGFREIRLERFTVPLPLVSPHIAGMAVK
jgi:SAM-dependent methyltransferase